MSGSVSERRKSTLPKAVKFLSQEINFLSLNTPKIN